MGDNENDWQTWLREQVDAAPNGVLEIGNCRLFVVRPSGKTPRTDERQFYAVIVLPSMAMLCLGFPDHCESFRYRGECRHIKEARKNFHLRTI